MIYIPLNQSKLIITDNFVNYIPDNLTIYLDDELLGTYVNESTSLLYLKFNINSGDTSNFQEREYNMKITNYSATIKEELVIVKDYYQITKTEVTTNKEKKFYEKR